MTDLSSLISDLVAIDSVNPDLVPGGAGESDIADYIAAWGRANQLEVSVQPTVPGRPNVILRAPGSGGGFLRLRPAAPIPAKTRYNCPQIHKTHLRAKP